MKGGTVRVAKGKKFNGGPQQGRPSFGKPQGGGWQGGMAKKSLVSVLKENPSTIAQGKKEEHKKDTEQE